ncbi:hypothetical protein SNE40_010339 [Patella caerulea]
MAEVTVIVVFQMLLSLLAICECLPLTIPDSSARRAPPGPVVGEDFPSIQLPKLANYYTELLKRNMRDIETQTSESSKNFEDDQNSKVTWNDFLTFLNLNLPNIKHKRKLSQEKRLKQNSEDLNALVASDSRVLPYNSNLNHKSTQSDTQSMDSVPSDFTKDVPSTNSSGALLHKNPRTKRSLFNRFPSFMYSPPLELDFTYTHVVACLHSDRYYCLNGGRCVYVGALDIKTCR